MNILFCSAGRRCELLKDFRKSMAANGKICATDHSKYSPAIYLADSHYIVPTIEAPEYIPVILNICNEEKIDAVTTCIDPEIEILAAHRDEFEAIGVKVLAPYEKTARICFDKYIMFQYLVDHGIHTVPTFGDFDSCSKALLAGNVKFPVFVKPRKGSGSVGARRIDTIAELKKAMLDDPGLIIQEYMSDAIDIDADVYVDTISGLPVSLFSKKKLETKIGGATKTISFKDEKLVSFVCNALKPFEFSVRLMLIFGIEMENIIFPK